MSAQTETEHIICSSNIKIYSTKTSGKNINKKNGLNEIAAPQACTMHTVIKMMYRRWLFRKVAESKYRRESRRKEKQQHASVSVSVRAGGFYKTSPQTKLMHYIETHFIHIYIYILLQQSSVKLCLEKWKIVLSKSFS